MLNMSDANDQKPVKPAKGTPLPPQASPTDTTNWDDRTFKAPDGKYHLENGPKRDRKNEQRYPPRKNKQQSNNQESAEPKDK